MQLEKIASEFGSRKAEFAKRRKLYVEETIPGPMLEEYQGNGWELVRTNVAGSHRVRKEKLIDEQLEDQCWCILYLLGYQNLNQSRYFKIPLTAEAKGPTKQIDVFAYDDSSIVVFECKTAKKRSSPHMGDYVNAFAGLRKPISDALRRHFGGEIQQTIIWAVVTRNIVWSDNDLKRADQQNIHVIRDTEVAYYSELSRRIGEAARYQFQAEFLKKSRALKDVKLFALRTKYGGEHVFSFFAPAKKILPVSFVNHRDLRDPEAAPSYQRMVQKSRLKKIGRYLDEGGYFPNSIIVHFHDDFRFDPIKKADEDDIVPGILTLPSTYKSVMIIDGQHRLYGHTQTDQETHDLQFLAFTNISVQEETKLFSDINFQQKTVSRSLLDEISGEIELDSKQPDQQMRAISSRTFDLMRSNLQNPLGDKIAGADLIGGGTGLLKLPTLNTAVKEAGLLGVAKTNKGETELVQGPIVWKTPKQAIARLYEFLTAYFELFRKASPERWDGGKEGVFARNISVAGLIKLSKDMIDVRYQITGTDPRNMSPEDIVADFKPLLNPLLKYFKETDPMKMNEHFKSKYGQGAPKEFQRKSRFIIHDAKPDFLPSGLEEQLREFGAARTELGDRLTRIVQERILTAVTDKLKAHYGDGPAYLVDAGLDTKIFGDLTSRQQDHRKKYNETLPVETFVDFIGWKHLVKKPDNWKLVGHIVEQNLEGIKNPNRNQLISWFDKMNDIRRIPAHPFGRESYSDSEMDFLQTIFKQLRDRQIILEDI